MINVRASVSLAGAAYQSGVAGRTHAHRGLCARPLGTAVLQDVHEASTPLGWTPPRRSAVRRDLSAISLSSPLVPVSPQASGRRATHRVRTDVRERCAMAPLSFRPTHSSLSLEIRTAALRVSLPSSRRWCEKRGLREVCAHIYRLISTNGKPRYMECLA
jgi:hypothetical protein